MGESSVMTVNDVDINLDMKLNCTDNNIIYVAHCKWCPEFYVGRSTTSMSIRNNGHRSKFNSKDVNKSALALHIYQSHRDKWDSKLQNYTFGLILKCPGDQLDKYEDIYVEKTQARIFGLNRMKVQR